MNTSDYDYTSMVFDDDDEYKDCIRIMYITVYTLTSGLGLWLNISVIICVNRWTCNIFDVSSMRALVKGLAWTHLVHCIFLPFQAMYAKYHFIWKYGVVLCKVSSYVTYVSMFSSASMLALWSACPCLAQIRWVPMLSCWMFGVIMALPSLISRGIQETAEGEQCVDKVAQMNNAALLATVVLRLIFGILLPFMATAFNCLRQRGNHGKRHRVILLSMQLVYLLFWGPLIFLTVAQIGGSENLVKFGLPIATALAMCHSCVNPILYCSYACLFSKDVKVARIKRNVGEEGL